MAGNHDWDIQTLVVLISAIVGIATTFLGLFVGVKLAKMKSEILAAVNRHFMRSDTGEMALNEIRRRLDDLDEWQKEHVSRCHPPRRRQA